MIRTARLADLDALCALERRCFESNPHLLSRRQFRHLLNCGNARCLVADAADGLSGYVLTLFRAGSRIARLYSIAVDPAGRGRGIGRRLLAAAESSALAAGARQIRLEVDGTGRAAISLYRGAGYQSFDRIPHYYGKGRPALRMAKALPTRPDRAAPEAALVFRSP